MRFKYLPTAKGTDCIEGIQRLHPMTDLKDRSDPSLQLTLQSQLTKRIHRQVYGAISPSNPINSAIGKIVLITGGGSGIGAVWI